MKSLQNNTTFVNTNTLQHNHDEYSSQTLKKQVINTACNRKVIEYEVKKQRTLF